MTKEEMLQQVPVPTIEDVTLGEIQDIIKPHTYMIGAAHLLPDHMYLDIEEAEKQGARCEICKVGKRKHGYPILLYKEHVKEATVLFLLIDAKDRKPSDIPGLQDYVKSIAAKLTELGIDGISFVDTTKPKRK